LKSFWVFEQEEMSSQDANARYRHGVSMQISLSGDRPRTRMRDSRFLSNLPIGTTRPEGITSQSFDALGRAVALHEHLILAC
jgi:hypothetical protein